MTPPGLGLAAVSDAARSPRAGSTPRFYFDWQRTREGAARSSTRRSRRRFRSSRRSTSRSACCSRRASTPHSIDTCGSAAPLARARRRWAWSSSRRTRTAARSSPPSARPTDRAEVISGVRDRFGITLAGGQGDLKGKIFRIGHIGWFDVFDITTALAAVELVLAELGADIERGVAVTAALEAVRALVASREGPRPRVDRRRRRRPAARALRRRRRPRFAARGDRRPLRRDRRPLGDEADGRADRARRRA